MGVVISMPIQSTAIIYDIFQVRSSEGNVCVCYNLNEAILETTVDWTLALTPLRLQGTQTIKENG